jgi:hypothetical protein
LYWTILAREEQRKIVTVTVVLEHGVALAVAGSVRIFLADGNPAQQDKYIRRHPPDYIGSAAGRKPTDIARAWLQQMTQAIRE